MQVTCSACHSHEGFHYSKATDANIKNLVFKRIVPFNILVHHSGWLCQMKGWEQRQRCPHVHRKWPSCHPGCFLSGPVSTLTSSSVDISEHILLLACLCLIMSSFFFFSPVLSDPPYKNRATWCTAGCTLRNLLLPECYLLVWSEGSAEMKNRICLLWLICQAGLIARKK